MDPSWYDNLHRHKPPPGPDAHVAHTYLPPSISGQYVAPWFEKPWAHVVGGFVKGGVRQVAGRLLLAPVLNSNLPEAQLLRAADMTSRARTGKINPVPKKRPTHQPKQKPVKGHGDVGRDDSDWPDDFGTHYGGGGGEYYNATSGQGYGDIPHGGRPRKIPVRNKPYGMPRKTRSGAKRAPPVHGGANKNNVGVGRVANLPGDGIQVELRAVKALVSNASGSVSLGYLLGDGSGTGSTISLDDVLTKLETFYGMYDWTRIVRLRLEYQPNVSFATTGFYGMAIDPNPRADKPADINDVSRHLHSITGDAKSPMILNITGAQLAKQASGVANWYTAEDTASLEWRAPGVLQVIGAYSEGGSPVATATVGHLHISATVQFKGLNAS